MFCYVAPSVCLPVPPHIQNNLLVWMLGFIAIFLLLEGRGFVSGSLFFFVGGGGGGGGGVFFKLAFLIIFFLFFWRNFISLSSTFTHSFTHFFFMYWGKCKCWTVFFVLWATTAE